MKQSKSKKKLVWIIIGIAVAAFALIVLFSNSIAILILDAYIDTFDPVEYENQLTPVKDENGYYSFTTDEDFHVMEINDIHLGGGRFTTKQDKKTIYEVMTMVQEEKPDLVVLDGDSIFAVPGPIFNGGGTLNNRAASKVVMHMFDQLGVYYTVTFGNHDTEAFDFTDREALGEEYEKDSHEYCIFESNYDGYGVTNQCIVLKNTAGDITKLLMMIDSNDYVDDSISASINWLYDTIHDEQVTWAANVVKDLSQKEGLPEGEYLKVQLFCHIPTGEFELAYRELVASNLEDTENTHYVGGIWDEVVNEELNVRIWYGGCQYNQTEDPASQDQLFEVLGPDGLDCLEAIYVGHDHTNNAVVEYKGVLLSYGYAMDNNAYDDIAEYGLQRGATVITISSDGSFEQVHKNAYLDYHCDPNAFYKVDLENQYYEDYVGVPYHE